MKILVLTHHDATNLSIVNILKELKSRGHEIKIFANFMDYKSIRMFNILNEHIYSIDKLDDKIINECNIIFCSLDVISKVINVNKYIFCYNFIFTGLLITSGADFMFTSCGDRKLDYYEDCSTMPIGNPKNDNNKYLVKNEDSKQILFIESGHYPFGNEGRRILAKLILDICYKYKEYELVVKPRFLPNDENITHENREHIYNVIIDECDKILPTNLTLLYEHLELQELINMSRTVLTTYSSAYLDVAISKKGLIAIDNLPNEDMFDMRKDRVLKDLKDEINRTGCLVDYREVLAYLPNGIKCNEKYITRKGFFVENVSSKIVDAIEHIWENILSKQKLPCIKQYDFITYKNDMIADENLTWEKLKSKRIKNCILNNSREFYFIKANLDYSKYYKLLEQKENNDELRIERINELIAEFEEVKRKIYIENSEKMIIDEIDQSFLFLAMDTMGLTNKIFEFNEKDILCKGTYLFLRGRNAFENLNYSEAIEQFKEYFKDISKRLYNKFATDKDEYKSCALFYMSRSYLELDKDETAENFFKECVKLEKENNIYKILYWYFKAERKMKKFKYKEAIQYFKEFLAILEVNRGIKVSEIYSTNAYYNIYEACLKIGDLNEARFYQKKYNYLIDNNKKSDLELYDLIKGKDQFNNGEYNEAIHSFEKFLNQAIEKDAEQVEFLNESIISAYFYTGSSYFEVGELRNALKNFEICSNLTNNNHRKASEYIKKIKEDI